MSDIDSIVQALERHRECSHACSIMRSPHCGTHSCGEPWPCEGKRAAVALKEMQAEVEWWHNHAGDIAEAVRLLTKAKAEIADWQQDGEQGFTEAIELICTIGDRIDAFLQDARPPCARGEAEHRWASEVEPADEPNEAWWDLTSGVGPVGGPHFTTNEEVFCRDCGATPALADTERGLPAEPPAADA